MAGCGGRTSQRNLHDKTFQLPSRTSCRGECLQLHGGVGLMDHHWCSRFYRDASALTIAAGTAEIMKELIASTCD